MSHILLIDGYGFIFRAYHSLPHLSAPNGEEIGAIYGFTSMIIRLLKEFEVSHIAMVYDSGKRGKRHELYPNYKANRPPVPPELITQFPIMREAANALGLRVVEKPGYEADDIIAELALSLSQLSDHKVTIISSDKDLMQLISPNISMYDPLKNKFIDRDKVIEKFGVPPEQVKYILALMGDASDNIPGVPSIGPKTAAELIQQFGTIDNIYANINAVKRDKCRQKLIEHQAQALLSYQLVCFIEDTGLECSLDDLKLNNLNEELLLEFLQKYNFKSLIGKANQHRRVINRNLNYIESLKVVYVSQSELSSLQDKLSLSKKLLLYPIYSKKKLASLLIKNDSSDIYLIRIKNEGILDFNNSASNSWPNMSQVLEFLGKIFALTFVHKITYQLELLAVDLYQYSPKTALNNVDDLAVLFYASGSGRSTNLTNIANHYHLGDKIDLTHLNREQILFSENNEDIRIVASTIIKTLELAYQASLKELKQARAFDLYHHIDKALIAEIALMHYYGIKLSLPVLQKLSNEYNNKLQILASEIYQIAGIEFNIGSPKQLSEILFTRLSIAYPGKKNTTSYSTAVDILEELAVNGYEIAEKLLLWRHYNKLITTYTDNLPKEADHNSSRLHSYFSQISTLTGRLSSSEPNLQNIPTRNDSIRQAFIAESGYSLLSVDYSQIELRILAHIADIKPMQQAFFDGRDIHTETAAQLFQLDPSTIDDKLRRKAKEINFGIIYGISAFGLAQRTGITRNEASLYINNYFASYPGIKQYMDNTVRRAQENGYVETIFGRKCYITDINNRSNTVKQFAQRSAINAPIQGSAADIIRKVMTILPPILRQKNIDARMVLQVHDELLFEVHDEAIAEASAIIKAQMESITVMKIPLKVSMAVAKNWGDLKK